jgi:serine/threonine protein kinase
MNNDPQIKVKKKKEIKFLSQGTFGCVFHPGIQCKTNKTESDKYISKVQVQDLTLKQEIDNGKAIRKIPGFKDRFAPILTHCKVDVSTIDNKQVDKCDVIMDSVHEVPPPRFISSKMSYAGNKELGEYLESLLTQPLKNDSVFHIDNQLEKYLKQLSNAHIYLLESIKLLGDSNIVHYDLKQNNIIYNIRQDIPILIDFGLSIQMDKLTPDTYKNAFYSLYETYEVWSIEILLLCYITKHIHKKDFKFTTAITSLQEVKNHISVYITENRALQKGILESERITFKKQIFEYVNSFLGKSWQTLWNDLIKSYKTWDNYSLAVVFIKELYHTEIPTLDQPMPTFLSNYINELKRVILSPPVKRPDAFTTLLTVKNIFHTVNKKEYEKFIEGSKKKMDAPFLQHIKGIVKQNTLRQLEDDDELVQRKQVK